MIKKGSVLLICKHKFVFQYQRNALLMTLKQCKLHQVSLHPPQNNSIVSAVVKKRKVQNFLTTPKMLPVGTEAAVHRGSIKKTFFQNFAKFTGKQIYRIFFFDKVAGLQAATLSKKRLPYKCFPVNFAKLLRTPFLQNTSRQLLLSTPRILFKSNKKSIRRCSM